MTSKQIMTFFFTSFWVSAWKLVIYMLYNFEYNHSIWGWVQLESFVIEFDGQEVGELLKVKPVLGNCFVSTNRKVLINSKLWHIVWPHVATWKNKNFSIIVVHRVQQKPMTFSLIWLPLSFMVKLRYIPSFPKTDRNNLKRTVSF